MLLMTRTVSLKESNKSHLMDLRKQGILPIASANLLSIVDLNFLYPNQ